MDTILGKRAPKEIVPDEGRPEKRMKQELEVDWQDLPVELWAAIMEHLDWENQIMVATMTKNMISKFNASTGIKAVRKRVREEIRGWDEFMAWYIVRGLDLGYDGYAIGYDTRIDWAEDYMMSMYARDDFFMWHCASVAKKYHLQVHDVSDRIWAVFLFPEDEEEMEEVESDAESEV